MSGLLIFLSLLISDLNPAEGRIQLMTVWRFIAHSLSLSFFHCDNIGIKHGFSCINICHVPWEVLKTVARGRGFQHLPRDLANGNALKNHVRSLLLHKN